MNNQNLKKDYKENKHYMNTINSLHNFTLGFN